MTGQTKETDEIFIAELESENRKLQAELNQITSLKSSTPASTFNQNQENVKQSSQLQTAAFAKCGSPKLSAELSAPDSLFHLKQSPINKTSPLNLVENKPRAITTSRAQRKKSVAESFENSVDSEGYEAMARRCKKFELRLIGAQKTVKSLQNAQRAKDDEVERLKRELKARERVIESLRAEKERGSRAEEMRRGLKLYKEKVEQLASELKNSLENNTKLQDKINEQNTLIEEYKGLLNSQMDAISAREE